MGENILTHFIFSYFSSIFHSFLFSFPLSLLPWCFLIKIPSFWLIFALFSTISTIFSSFFLFSSFFPFLLFSPFFFFFPLSLLFSPFFFFPLSSSFFPFLLLFSPFFFFFLLFLLFYLPHFFIFSLYLYFNSPTGKRVIRYVSLP